MIIANLTNKTLQKGEYIKKFDDVKTIDDLLKKIKIPEQTTIQTDDKELYCSWLLDERYRDYAIEFIEGLPIFDEHILDNDLSNIKLKRYKPKADWQLQFGKEVYITNDGKLREQFIDKDVFCFTVEDLKEFKKNNWNIDDDYMLRVFFGGKDVSSST